MKDLSPWAALYFCLARPLRPKTLCPPIRPCRARDCRFSFSLLVPAWCIGESGDGARRRTNCGLEQIGQFRAIGCEEPGLSRVRISCSPPFGFNPAIHCSANVVLGVTFTRIKRT